MGFIGYLVPFGALCRKMKLLVGVYSIHLVHLSIPILPNCGQHGFQSITSHCFGIQISYVHFLCYCTEGCWILSFKFKFCLVWFLDRNTGLCWGVLGYYWFIVSRFCNSSRTHIVACSGCRLFEVTPFTVCYSCLYLLNIWHKPNPVSPPSVFTSSVPSHVIHGIQQTQPICRNGCQGRMWDWVAQMILQQKSSSWVSLFP